MDYIHGNVSASPLPLTGPWSDTPGETAGGGSTGGQYAVDAASSGIVTATLTWMPAAGKSLSTDPPSEPVFILETALAAWSTSSAATPTAGAYVSDGLGDPVLLNPSYLGGGQTSSGSHLIAQDGSSGIIRLGPIPMSAGTPPYQMPIQWGCASAQCTFSVSFPTPPKSVLILRPENSPSNVQKDQYYLDGNGEWQGSGDSRFDNLVYYDQEQLLSNGIAPGWEDWIADPVGGPWPPQPTLINPITQYGDWSRNWYAEDDNVQPASGLGSDSGNTYQINKFTPHIRPHVDWPYSASLLMQSQLPHDLLEQMTSPNAPAPKTLRVNLHLTDVDLTNIHPEYSFDHHANFFITYHNEYELKSESPPSFLTSADIPWQIAKGPNGQPISQAAYATPIPGWSPQLQYYVEANWQANVNFVSWAGVSAGQNFGSGLTATVSGNIPANYIGVVYSRPHEVRIPFTYRHYLPGGREIQGYDTQGNEIPFSNHVDRSPFGFGTYPVDFIIFTFPNGTYPIPQKINHDPIPSP